MCDEFIESIGKELILGSRIIIVKKSYITILAILLIFSTLSLLNGCAKDEDAFNQSTAQDPVEVSRTLSETAPDFHIFISQIETACLPSKNTEIAAYLSAINEYGDLIDILTLSNFQINLDAANVEPKAVHFAPIDNFILDPLSVVIIMDYSTSVTDFPEVQTAMEDAVIGFINLMQPKDQAEIIKFNTGIKYLQPFTKNTLQLTDAVTSSQDITGGHTYLYDALYTGLEDAATQTGRKAVIVITDGTERHVEGIPGDGRGKKDIITLARTKRIPVFIIGLGPDTDGNELAELTRTSAGYFFQAKTIDQLEGIYTNISNLLNFGHYLLVFETSPNGKDHYDLALLASLNGLSDNINATIPFAICP
jgi:Mg-chelatase subunit ChlD